MDPKSKLNQGMTDAGGSVSQMADDSSSVAAPTMGGATPLSVQPEPPAAVSSPMGAVDDTPVVPKMEVPEASVSAPPPPPVAEMISTPGGMGIADEPSVPTMGTQASGDAMMPKSPSPLTGTSDDAGNDDSSGNAGGMGGVTSGV